MITEEIEIGAVEYQPGDYITVTLTAGGVRLNNETAAGSAEVAALKTDDAAWLRTLLGRALEMSGKEQ